MKNTKIPLLRRVGNKIPMIKRDDVKRVDIGKALPFDHIRSKFKNEIKIIVAGGRNFNDYKLLKRVLIKAMKHVNEKHNTSIQIVSGGAKGADYLGERFAHENNLFICSYPADWDKYGKSAGYRRNVEMAKVSDYLIAFWDGKSKGTKHMIDIAYKNKLKVIVVKYKD